MVPTSANSITPESGHSARLSRVSLSSSRSPSSSLHAACHDTLHVISQHLYSRRCHLLHRLGFLPHIRLVFAGASLYECSFQILALSEISAKVRQPGNCWRSYLRSRPSLSSILPRRTLGRGPFRHPIAFTTSYNTHRSGRFHCPASCSTFAARPRGPDPKSTFYFSELAEHLGVQSGDKLKGFEGSGG